jgi:ABC-three component (ABC-3C) system Middle Component 6
MILPSKHLSQDRALLSVGAKILQHLKMPKTVSAIWEELSKTGCKTAMPTIGYNSFILALDLLYSMNAIEMEDGVLSVKN